MFGWLESGGAETVLGVVFAVAIRRFGAAGDWLFLGFHAGFLRLRGSAGRGNWRTTAGPLPDHFPSGSVRQDSCRDGGGSVRQGPRTTPSEM